MPTYTPAELFASTAPYYARHRPGYDPALYDLLAERFALDGTQRILDLGTGTGVLALPLAALAAEVIAVDPEPGMLDEGRKLAAERGVTNIAWRHGDSTTLPGMDIGEVLLTVMGAAFHWMDRDQVLRDLDRIIAPEGGVVLASGGAPGDIQPAPWLDVVADVRTRYLGPQRRAGSSTYTHPRERHQDILARSPFSRIETTHWDRTLIRTTDDVIGYVFSLSYSSPAQLGDAKDAFEHNLRAALLDFNPEGRFEEIIRTEAIIATRP
ncbi:class I SAM-dependent methyltransferase [Streptomyces millisiae]|uniref:Class I SAM-dependent methyltransferase n=1 Tax=Streptomyces millisiae TaxID=3075542 RepID=A0ABU2LM27_9ACTN|nr:class I SAM-dependent methyltransferase [Streptomyces sp. DSM 44918]MDT0318560.1 class I SAM-dependent methyltransferase [Streptomyces sp. DSM 44918]